MSRGSVVLRRDFLRFAVGVGTALVLGLQALVGIPVAPKVTAAAVPQRGGTLTIATALEMTNIDPNLNIGSQHISTLWMEALTSIGVDGKIVPSLAESWDISPDGRTYTFRIRPGVTFHNAKPLTAGDVKFTFDRSRDPQFGAAQRAFLTDVEEVNAVDDRTVRVQLKQPYGPLINALAEMWIVPEGSAGADGKIDRPIGTGPFEFVSWTPNKETVVKRYAGYWQRDLPYLDGIVVKVIPDDTTRMAALRSGDVQLMQGFPAVSLETIRGGGFNHAGLLDPSTWTLAFNMFKQPPPINRINVRRAIALSINKEEILRARVGTSGIGQVSYQQSSKGEFWHGEGMPNPFPRQDLAAARRLLAQEGVAGARLVLPANPETQKLAEVVTGQLSRVGFNVQLDVVDRTANRPRLERYDWHVVLNVTGPRTEPSLKYVFWYGGNEAPFLGHLQSSEVNELYLKAIRISNPEERKRTYGEMWRLIQEKNIAAVALIHDNNVFAYATKLQGFEPNRLFYLHSPQRGLSRAWLAR